MTDRILETLCAAKRRLIIGWCKGAEAIDADAQPVLFCDPGAVAWDIEGALLISAGVMNADARLRCTDPRYALFERALRMVDAGARVLSFADAAAFNDHGATRRTDVLNLLNLAIRSRKSALALA